MKVSTDCPYCRSTARHEIKKLKDALKYASVVMSTVANTVPLPDVVRRSLESEVTRSVALIGKQNVPDAPSN